MSPYLLLPALVLLALCADACRALATQRPHTPSRAGKPLTPVDALASGLQAFAGRHPDGTTHDFTTAAPVGVHACTSGVGYCHHEALACRCGAQRVTGYAIEEMR